MSKPSCEELLAQVTAERDDLKSKVDEALPLLKAQAEKTLDNAVRLLQHNQAIGLQNQALRGALEQLLEDVTSPVPKLIDPEPGKKAVALDPTATEKVVAASDQCAARLKSVLEWLTSRGTPPLIGQDDVEADMERDLAALDAARKEAGL